MQLSWPGSLAIDSTGNVYVADNNNHRVVKLTPQLAFAGAWGGLGSKPGQLTYPRAIASDAAGDTYVADFLGVSNLMEVDVVERGPGQRCQLKVGEAALVAERGEIDGLGPAHAVIRPERVRIEAYGSPGDNRVPAMVERLVFLGAVMLYRRQGHPALFVDAG